MSGCYPFYLKDPFILEECPHVYFSGNAPTFESKVIKGQCVMCILHVRNFVDDLWTLDSRDQMNKTLQLHD